MVGSQAEAALARGVRTQVMGGKVKEDAMEMMKARNVPMRPRRAARPRRRAPILKWLTPIALRVPISDNRSRTLEKAR